MFLSTKLFVNSVTFQHLIINISPVIPHTLSLQPSSLFFNNTQQLHTPYSITITNLLNNTTLVSSICTNKFGCRATTIAGGVIAGVGCILSSFASSVEVLCLTFGIIGGFGLSMVYAPAVIIVAFYFEKKRAFATGRLFGVRVFKF